ncbi:MAG: AMP-binding protein [Muribaculaceae bacterium]|nr:AMP-binding protein [Muribaculaceae bacterium]
MEFKEFLEEWNNDENFIRAHTSGSTGCPKEILLPKYFVKESAKRTNEYFGIRKNSWLHSCVAADFIGGKMMAVRAEIARAIFTYEKPTNKPLQNLTHGTEIDLIAVVPSQVPFIIENKDVLPKIRNLLVGGSPIHPQLRKKIVESGINAYESYGMTETASHIALRKILDEETPFKLLPNISITYDKDNCLVINFEDKTEIYTNDIVELVSNTEFFIRGRRDHIIITGGRKVNPVEIESRISHLLNQPFLITGVPDEKWGEKVIMMIEGHNKDNNLRKNLNDILEKWQVPKDIFHVPTLPRTANGKLMRIKDLSFLSSFDPDNNLSS